ncbi:O-Antigen Polymerase [Methylophaga aminisulfidivorans MP]|uniref:O-Antigen Polymerase n=1 Tax=Methylophaga aminisulfidivorans MP TaxID=1026882 RepID=F5SYN8_9GAMM|nr:O-antigen ligase family protein [Methylophaga aminisulfidivorans]EGL54418.1 O-Antigen Polymerase [Methylophaga aminisulfidivorans MP]
MLINRPLGFPPAAHLFLYLLPALLLFSRAIADVTVVLVAIAFLIFSFKKCDWDWVKQPWFLAFLLFNAYLLVVNLPLSSDSSESLKYVLTFIRWPLFAVALSYWVFNDAKKRQCFLISLLLTMLFIIADTLWQYFFDVDWFGIERFSDTRLTGPFRSPIPGTMLLRLWFIALFAAFFIPLFKSSVLRQLTFLMVAMGSGFVFTFLTGERMALILFSSGCAIVFIAMLLEYKQYKQSLLFMLAILGITLMITLFLSPEMFERSIVSIGSKLSTFAESDYGSVFKAAWQVWQDNWWLGSGLHTYQTVCEQQQLLIDSGLMCTHPHNLYLQLGAETGVVGLCLFLFMLYLLYKKVLGALLGQRDWIKAALSFSVLTVSFWPLTGGISVLSNWVAALVWLGIAWVLAISSVDSSEPDQCLTDVNR